MFARRWPVLVLGALVVLGISLLEDAVVAGARGVGYSVCHQLPDRSFFAEGKQFPLCARCTGIYLGFLVGVAGLALLGKLNATRWPPGPVNTVLFLAMGTMIADGLNSLMGTAPGGAQLYESTNLLRLVTGTSAGLALALLVIPMVNDSLWARRDPSPSVSDFGELAGFMIIAALVGVLVYSEHPVMLLPVSILGALGVLATLGSAGTALAVTLARRERQSESLQDALPFFTIGLGLSIASMAMLAGLRYYFAIGIGI